MINCSPKFKSQWCLLGLLCFGAWFDIRVIPDGLVQDCSNSIASALELLQSSTKPSVYALKPIETGWRIYASVHCFIIGSGNDLPVIRRQGIICTNDVVLVTGPGKATFGVIKV